MFLTRKLISYLPFFATLVRGRAEIPEQASMYPYMAEAMERYGLDYTWRAYETTAHDGYVLTMFRITADNSGEKIEG